MSVNNALENLKRSVGELNTIITLTETKIEVELGIATPGLRAYSDALFFKASSGLHNFEQYKCTEDDFYRYLQWIIVQRVLYVRREAKFPGVHEMAGLKIPAFLAVMLLSIGQAKDEEHGLIYIPTLCSDVEVTKLKSMKLSDFAAPVRVCKGLEALSEVMCEEFPRSSAGDPEIMALQYLRSKQEIKDNARAPLFQGEGVYGYMPNTHAGFALFIQILELRHTPQIMAPVIYFGMYKHLSIAIDGLVQTRG